MTTLLEQAKEVKVLKDRYEKPTNEEMELAFAFLDGKVTYKQVAHVINKPQGVQGFVHRCLLQAYRKGQLIKK